MCVCVCGGGGGGGGELILLRGYHDGGCEGLEEAEPIEPGPLGPTASHSLRRMLCELFQVKTPSRTHLLILLG